MIDLEKYLVKNISKRCKALRLNLGIPMEKISDRSAISRIENGKIPESGNFITETVINDYASIFNKSPREIIFGNDNELQETLQWLFGEMFRLIRLKNLETDIGLYGNLDSFDVDIQKTVLLIAEAFAEFNLKRHNFLKTDDTYMDIVSKKFDHQLLINGKLINIERDYRREPINESTVIDLFDMEEKLWLIFKKKFISSFNNEVIEVIVNDFKFSSINYITKKWIKDKFSVMIVPDVIEKLKSIPIFKIGFIVKSLINDFLEEDLSISFQDTVPLQIKRPESYEIRIDNINFDTLLEDGKNYTEVVNDILNKLQDNKEEALEICLRYGVSVEIFPEESFIQEVEIENVLERAIQNRGNNRTLTNPSIIELGPIFDLSKFNSKEELEEAQKKWFENKHFKNQNIPGYLSNNSQILNVLQKRMNENTYEMIDEYIDIQNNLLNLLTEKDLEKL